MQRKKNIFKFG